MKLIIIISLILILSCNGASAWYDGFDYRIPITIDNAGNPALEHYQFNVSFSLGINETSIRVVNDTDYTIVPHWCENETGGLCYELWFNVSVGSEVNTDYYIYYGNDPLSSTSDYDNTFTKKYNDSGLVLELHMDEGSGNSVAVDSSGEGNDGTLTNMNTIGNTTSGWQGTDGGQWDNRSDVIFSSGDQLRFDGVNDYVNCGNGVSLRITDALTASAWIKMPSLPIGADQRTILRKDACYAMYFTEDYLHFALFGPPTAALHYLTTTFTTDDWHMVSFVYDKDAGSYNRKIYLDGNQVAQRTDVAAIVTTASDVAIGKRIDADGRFFNGTIDEVRLYNRSLSGDEIYRQYIRSKYAANTPLISIGYIEEIPHPFLSGAYLFYGEMTAGLTGFRDGMGRYLIWGVVFFAVSLAFTLIAKIKTTLIGGK